MTSSCSGFPHSLAKISPSLRGVRRGFIEGIEGEGPGIVDGAGQLRGLLLQLLRKAAMRRLLQQGIFHLLLQLIFYQIGEQHPLLGGVFSLHRHSQKEGAEGLSQAVGPLQVAVLLLAAVFPGRFFPLGKGRFLYSMLSVDLYFFCQADSSLSSIRRRSLRSAPGLRSGLPPADQGSWWGACRSGCPADAG